jgi:hypothetical protein
MKSTEYFRSTQKDNQHRKWGRLQWSGFLSALKLALLPKAKPTCEPTELAIEHHVKNKNNKCNMRT